MKKSGFPRTIINLCTAGVFVFAILIASVQMAQADAYNTYPYMNATPINPATGDYWIDENGNGQYDGTEESKSPRGFYYRNCTDGAAHWVQQYTGVVIPGSWSHAKYWDDHAGGYTVKQGNANTIEVGDIAQSDYGDFGHVGFVTDVAKDAGGNVVSIAVAELNKSNQGEFSHPTYISKNSGGKFIRWGSATWDHFIDVNGSNTSSLGRLIHTNGGGLTYGKDTTSWGDWHPLAQGPEIVQVSAAGTQLAVLTTTGQAWKADVHPDNLAANNPGLQLMDIPNDPGYPGGVKQIEVDQHGNMIAINNCNAAYGYRNIAGHLNWVPMTDCNEAVQVDIGGGRMVYRSTCGASYASDEPAYNWQYLLGCNDTQDIAVGESRRVIAINGCGGAYARNNPDPNEGWKEKAPCGSAADVDYGKNRMVIRTPWNQAYATDHVEGQGGLTWLGNVGDCLRIVVGSNDRMMMINGSGAAWHSDVVTPGGQWTQQTGAGDVTTIEVG